MKPVKIILCIALVTLMMLMGTACDVLFDHVETTAPPTETFPAETILPDTGSEETKGETAEDMTDEEEITLSETEEEVTTDEETREEITTAEEETTEEETTEEISNYSMGLSYTSKGDGTCYVSGIGSCTDTVIVIPPEHNGKRVVGIQDDAFRHCSTIQRVVLPSGIETIGATAFAFCSDLKSIIISDTVKSMNHGAFAGSRNLTSIQVDPANPYLHSTNNCVITNEGKVLLAGCSTSIIPDDGSVERIEISAFYSCGLSGEVRLPASIKSIGIFAFDGCQISKFVYHGTKNQWTRVVKEIGWNRYISDYTIQCTDGLWENSALVHVTFDQLFIDGQINESDKNLFTPGKPQTWDGIADLTETEASTLTYFGWIGTHNKIGQFGYKIGDGSVVYDDAFTWETEPAVHNTAREGAYGFASRMKVMIPLEGISGMNQVSIFYKTSTGIEVCLSVFTIIV